MDMNGSVQYYFDLMKEIIINRVEKLELNQLQQRNVDFICDLSVNFLNKHQLAFIKKICLKNRDIIIKHWKSIGIDAKTITKKSEIDISQILRINNS